MAFGLRWGGIHLMQISGDARVRLAADGREWWGKPPAGRPEVFETDVGQVYVTKDDAEKVASNFERHR